MRACKRACSCAGQSPVHSVPCRAAPCRSVPLRAVPCRAVPCRVRTGTMLLHRAGNGVPHRPAAPSQLHGPSADRFETTFRAHADGRTPRARSNRRVVSESGLDERRRLGAVRSAQAPRRSPSACSEVSKKKARSASELALHNACMHTHARSHTHCPDRILMACIVMAYTVMATPTAQTV